MKNNEKHNRAYLEFSGLEILLCNFHPIKNYGIPAFKGGDFFMAKRRTSAHINAKEICICG